MEVPTLPEIVRGAFFQAGKRVVWLPVDQAESGMIDASEAKEERAGEDTDRVFHGNLPETFLKALPGDLDELEWRNQA